MIIYLKDTTEFNNNGLGFLTDILSAKVYDELNGNYYLEFEYLLNGKLSEYLVKENIIKCKVADGSEQLFIISNIEKNLKTIKITARHIFYRLIDNLLEDVYPKNLNGNAFLNWILEHTDYENEFTGYSDISNYASARYIRKNPIEAILGDDDNSMVNIFGGEIKRDNFTINFLTSIGSNKNEKLIFGKNIKEINIMEDATTILTRIMPIGFNGLILPEKYIDSDLINAYQFPKIGIVNFDDVKYDPDDERAYHDIEEAYQIMRDRVSKLYENGVDKSKINIKINWLELSKTKEYEQYSTLERLYLGDSVICNIAGLDYSTKVIKTVYNVLTDTIDKFEIGTPSSNIGNSMNNINGKIEQINPQSIIEYAKNNATDLITQAMGGYIYKTQSELYIMDTNNPQTAQRVWRWNINGLGYSSTGINGPYGLAMTMNGQIIADFITAGKLNTNVIEGYDQLIIKVSSTEEEINDVTITTPTIESNNDIYLTQAKEDYAIEYKANGVCEQDDTPTPSSPQEIRTIKGDNNNQLKIKVTGKNFWNLGNEYNFTSTVQTWHFLNGSQGAYGSNIGSKTTYKYFCKSGKKYIFQMYLENQLRGSSLVWSDETDSGITRLSSSSNTTQGLMVFKIIGKDDYVIPRVSVFANQQVSITGVMIEEVDDDVETPSPYELYKENIVLIDMNQYDNNNNIIGYYELCKSKIGDYKDTLSIDSSGNCVINKKIGKVILNGSEDWEVQYSGDRHGWRTTVPNLKQTTSANQESYAISNYYESKSQDAVFNDTYGISNRSNQSQIIIKNNDIASTNDFKAWLSTHNIPVYYVLNTPETIILGDTKIPLFEGINYITLVNDLETNTSITYYKKTPLSNQMRRLSERVQSVDENVSIISEEVDGHEARLTEVDQRIDGISQQVEEEIVISKKVTNTGSITLQNAFETQLHKLVIKGNISVIEPQEGEYGYPLVPRDDLVPSDSLTPSNPVPHSEITVIDDSILMIDNVEYELDFDFLNYISDSICDKYVIEDGNCYIIRKIGIDSNGNKYAIDDEVIEPKAPISLIVNKNSTIRLKSTEDAILEATYLLDNPYTNSFTTNYKVKTEIQQAKDEINAQVVGNDEVAAKMNLALREGQGVIEFVGNQFLVKSDNLDIDRYGNVKMRGGNIVLQNGSQILGDDGLKSTMLVLSNICSQKFVGGSTLLPMGFSLVGQDQYNNPIINKDWLSLEFEIPNDFVITNAKIILTHVPVNYTGDNTATGYCRKLKLYKSSNGLNQSITLNDMYYVFENSDVGYTEIQNAFGQNGFTGNSSYGEETSSIELKDYITTGFNKFKIQSDENTPTTLAQCYQYSGACMATLYITGYTQFNEVGSSNRSLSNLNQQNEIELRNNETNLNEEENNEQTRTINQQLEIDNTNLDNKEKENNVEESNI